MIVFPKQICKRILPDTGESRSDKTFFLKTNMELPGGLHLPGKHVPQERCSVRERDTTSQWRRLKWSKVTLLSPASTMLVLMKTKFLQE